MIRPLRLNDLLALKAMQHNSLRLDLPRSLVRSRSPLAAALVSRWPLQFGAFTYVYENEGKTCAFVQARTHQDENDSWDILYLGCSLPLTSDSENAETPPEEKSQTLQEADLRTALLEHVVMAGGNRGVKRVFATVSDDRIELEEFRKTGFVVYAHENIFGLLQGPGEAAEIGSLAIHPQRSRHSWGIQQLYRSITPKNVQQAEALTSHHWRRAIAGLPGSVRQVGYVVEDGQHISAYLRLSMTRHIHLLEILFAPEHRDYLEEIIRFGVNLAMQQGNVPIYCTVRDYQSELESALEANGFGFFGHQVNMVKYTTAFVKAPAQRLVPARRTSEVLKSPVTAQIIDHTEVKIDVT